VPLGQSFPSFLISLFLSINLYPEVEPVIEDVKFSNKCPKLPSLEDLYITQRTDKYEMFMDNLLVAQLQKKHAKVLHKALTLQHDLIYQSRKMITTVQKMEQLNKRLMHVVKKFVLMSQLKCPRCEMLDVQEKVASL